jgi:hypothetical protein
MLGYGYTPPPIDLTETLKNYYTVDSFDNLLTSTIKSYFPIGNIYITIDKNFDPNIFYNGTWSLINGSFSDSDYLNMYFNTNDLNIIEENDGTKWL